MSLFICFLQPTVCERELCVFAFQTLGVMNEAADEIATGAQVNNQTQNSYSHSVQNLLTKWLNNLCLWQQVVDLLVSMCRSALESPRKVVIFEPYPSVVDPNDSQALAFNPRVLKTLRAFSFTLPRLFCVMLLLMKEYYIECLGSSSEKGL